MSELQRETYDPFPTIAPAARLEIARELQYSGGHVETAWVADWDAPAQAIVSVKLMARGSRDECFVVSTDCVPGQSQMVLHSHPSASLEPSKSDLEVAKDLAALGLGFAICSVDGERLYVVREPRAPSAEIKLRLASRRVWKVKLWRVALLVFYFR